MGGCLEVIPSVQPDRRRVCGGTHVDVCVPEPSDYPFLIALRNQEGVRRWFLDDRVIELAAGIEWLAARACGHDDVLFLIRHRIRNINIGSIGWCHLDHDNGSVELGRLALDSAALRRLVRSGEPRSVIRNLALDASLALREHAFRHLGIDTIRTCYKPDNIAAAEINRACGMRICQAPENSPANLVYLQLTRTEWERILLPTP